MTPSKTGRCVDSSSFTAPTEAHTPNGKERAESALSLFSHCCTYLWVKSKQNK